LFGWGDVVGVALPASGLKSGADRDFANGPLFAAVFR
jgi:hypothetical protein